MDFFTPSGVVANEKGYPDGPCKPLDDGLQQHKHRSIRAQPPENPVVVNGHADGHEPEYESNNADQKRQRIAHIAGAKIEARVQFILLGANGAVLRHLHGHL
jgi:hypothetical protein